MRHGVLLIDKPAGITSHDVVDAARRALHERSIGHLGTLDPLATGLLVLFVGKKALKAVELFQSTEKEYETRAHFGAVSSTYDRDGVIEQTPDRKGWHPPTQSQLNDILQSRFLGEIRQTPPAYSAVHIDGERAYEIIRRNPDAVLDLKEREITVTKMQLISYAYPSAMLLIGCSSGTYIRSIVHDLGQVLRCGAYVEALRRTKVGSWRVEDAEELDGVSWADVIPLKEILSDFPCHHLSDEEWEHIRHGRVIPVRVMEEPLIAWHRELPAAILERKGDGAKARKVFS
jgi:tRNA pseudouridine55 synthase